MITIEEHMMESLVLLRINAELFKKVEILVVVLPFVGTDFRAKERLLAV